MYDKHVSAVQILLCRCLNVVTFFFKLALEARIGNNVAVALLPEQVDLTLLVSAAHQYKRPNLGRFISSDGTKLIYRILAIATRKAPLECCIFYHIHGTEVLLQHLPSCFVLFLKYRFELGLTHWF